MAIDEQKLFNTLFSDAIRVSVIRVMANYVETMVRLETPVDQIIESMREMANDIEQKGRREQ